MEIKHVCPKCFAETGLSIVLEKKTDFLVCPRCGATFTIEDGIVKELK